jgi:hypothetical protein
MCLQFCYFAFAVLGEGRIPISCHSRTCNSWLSRTYNKGTNNSILLSMLYFVILDLTTCTMLEFVFIYEICLHLQGYGCPGLSVTASAVSIAEVSRVDASCSAFILVHSSLAMSTIGKASSYLQDHFLCSVLLDFYQQLTSILRLMFLL